MKNIKLSFLLLIACFLFQTIAYSAISSTMKITGSSYARVEKNIRITEFKLNELSTNSVSFYEEYNTTMIKSSVFLPDSNSYIIYKIEVTNYGNIDIGIKSITGLPSNLSYELINYNLKDKLCNSSNQCNLGSTTSFYIKIKYNNYDSLKTTYDLNLTLNFGQFYNITYTGIEDTTLPTEILDGETLNIDFGTEKVVNVYIDEQVTNFFDGILLIENISNNLTVEVKNREYIKFISGNINTIGSEVYIGDEHFYIYKNDGETVYMLAKYNLYVGGVFYISQPSNIYERYGEEATGLQNSIILGYGETYRKGVLAFSNSNYWASSTTSYPAYVYNSNCPLYNHVEFYKLHLNKLGLRTKNARLISLEELIELDCSLEQKTCTTSPYSWTYSTSYWMGTAYSSKTIYDIYRNGPIDNYIHSGNDGFGVRPVIEVAIKDFKYTEVIN